MASVPGFTLETAKGSYNLSSSFKNHIIITENYIKLIYKQTFLVFFYSYIDRYFDSTEHTRELAKVYGGKGKFRQWNVENDAVCVSISDADSNGYHKKLWFSRGKRRCVHITWEYTDKIE